MPVRKTNRGHGGLTGHLALRDGQIVHFESGLEHDLYLLLRYRQQVTREVQSFAEQPLVIHYIDAQGVARRYTPDVLAHFTDQRPSELIEVKYRHVLRDRTAFAALLPRFQAARALCRTRGWRFRVATELSIRTPLLQHAAFLPAYLDRRHDPADLHLVLLELQRQQQTTPRRVLDALVPETAPGARRGDLLAVLWTLVARGFAVADPPRPIDLDLPLTARYG